VAPAVHNILTDSTGMIKLINVLPLDSAPSLSPQEDILALGLLLANLANEISPVSKRVSEIVERMVGATGREHFDSLAELALMAADLEHEMFAPSGPPPVVAVEPVAPKKTKPVVIVAGIVAVALVVVGIVAWRMHSAKQLAPSSPAPASATP